MTKFSERLREVRKERKISQAKLAEKLKVKQSAIAKWETGDREPDFDMLIQICSYFKVPSDYMLGLIDY